MPDPEETETMRERARERLAELIEANVYVPVAPVGKSPATGYHVGPELAGVDKAVSAIMREFALRPVSQGKVDAETGEVK